MKCTRADSIMNGSFFFSFFWTRQHFYRYDEVEAVARASARLQPDLSALTALSDTHYRSSSNPSRGHFLPVVRTGRLKGGKASGACSCHLASAARRKHFAGFPAEWALQVPHAVGCFIDPSAVFACCHLLVITIFALFFPMGGH